MAQSSSRSIRRKRPAFRFIDLFAGIGGLRRGFEQIGGHCVFTSEWNTQSQKTYAANFRADDQHLLAGDITQVDAADIPQHDVLLAGFPCQPFSIAGVSKKNSLGRAHGFRDEAQGTLFFDVARIIEHHKPAAFLLENVKNLARHDKGRTFQVIVRTLHEELGYHNLHWRILNARCWVPQNRERIFLAGFRNSNGFSFDNLILPVVLACAQFCTRKTAANRRTNPTLRAPAGPSIPGTPSLTNSGSTCRTMPTNIAVKATDSVLDWSDLMTSHAPCLPDTTRMVQKFLSPSTAATHAD